MEIIKNGNVITITGNIKNMNDANKLNETLKEFRSGNSVTIKIIDSFAIPSAIIGILLKKLEEDVNIKLEVGNNILYEVLDDLNLIKKLNVTKI
ncbi:MAG: hypothetical protein DSY40_02895 [Nautilia sp.]|nr:MAG: hypothetical protein DSY40_02895 [Nautilia sp.]